MADTQPGRRVVLAMGLGVTAGALAGCQVYGRQEGAAPPPPPPPPPVSPSDDGDGNGSGDGNDDGDDDGNDDGGAAVGTPLASAGDVAVGGGVILADQDLVITQPSAGDFKAFSATCTHQGCTVSDIADGTIKCNCHQSKFSIADGSVVQSASTLPAGATQDPLPERAIAVDGDTIGLP